MLILIQNVLCTVFGIGLFIMIKDKPDKPPSAVSKLKTEDIKLISVFKQVLQIKNYVLLLIIFTNMDGIQNSLPPLMSPMFNYYNEPGETEIYTP